MANNARLCRRVSSGDSTQLIYLRARYYSSTDARFLSKDKWDGNNKIPMSYNAWLYTYANPVNATDPTGRSICYNPLPTSCQNGLAYVKGFASAIKGFVESGMLLPVEGFAMLADNSKDHFNGDIRDLIWAMTIVLNDFDANRDSMWRQAPSPFSRGPALSPFFIGQDWLPYMHNSEYDTHPEKGELWCYPKGSGYCVSQPWIHSLRGDWNAKYWDKTSNQAYHFWFYVAATFFDSRVVATYANYSHDNSDEVVDYDFIGSAENDLPPTPSHSTQPDRDLAYAGMNLGQRLTFEYYMEEQYGCDFEKISPAFTSTDIGSWIRSNLK